MRLPSLLSRSDDERLAHARLHRTAETFVDGWVRTGDEGRIDAQGELFITDRIKELIKVRGLQVAPSEIEGLLVDHPAVADVCVVGVPDEYSGELPYAFVVLRPAARTTALARGKEGEQALRAELLKVRHRA